ncbi:MAG: cupin domain-containing protein [Chromatiales bacterium]|nr:cupin domain-containing protein [Chromatiales bacterium]
MKFLVKYACLSLFAGSVWALDANPVKVEQLAKTSTSWNGSTLPAYSDGQPEITILKITVQPNVELAWHTHPVINAGVMTKGRLIVITESGEKLELKAGDTIVEVVGKIHRGINPGPEMAEIVVFYAGVQGKPITVKK